MSDMNEMDEAGLEQEERAPIFDWPDPPPFTLAADEPHDLPITEDPQPMTRRAIFGTLDPMRAPRFGGSDEDGM